MRVVAHKMHPTCEPEPKAARWPDGEKRQRSQDVRPDAGAGKLNIVVRFGFFLVEKTIL